MTETAQPAAPAPAAASATTALPRGGSTAGRSPISKLLALALAGPLAGAVYFGLLLLRGPGELFERGEPMPPAHVDRFADVAALSAWPEPRDWPMFGHDPHHSHRAPLDFGSADLEPAWPTPFVPDRSGHVWNVEKSACVWSPIVVGRVPMPTELPTGMPGGTPPGMPSGAASGSTRSLLFVGSYDRSLYALDAASGQLVWRFPLNSDGAVYSSPALAMIAGRALLFAAGSDRIIYALDAATGRKVWARETRPWSQSALPAAMSSPVPVVVFGRTLLLVGVWNGDRSGLDNTQDGSLWALDAATGETVWRVRLGTSPVTTPAVATLRSGVWIFAASEDGSMRALDARNGRVLWSRTLHQELRSSPALGLTTDDVPVAVIGTRFHSVYGLGATNGAKLWMFQTGYWVDGTPAVADAGDGQGSRAYFGSYDWGTYAVKLGQAGRVRAADWKFAAANEARTPPVAVTVNGQLALLTATWDSRLHLLDGRDGRSLWQQSAGSLIFGYEFQGDSLWAGPAVADVGGSPCVFWPAVDGKIYAFRARPQRR